MTTLTVLVILSTAMLASSAPSPGIHIDTGAYEVHPPVAHHVSVYHEAYHPYHAPIVAPVVPVVHSVPYHHTYVQPVAYKVKTHYHLFGK